MAYNNYGAFAYLNGVRQRDREDVTLDQILNETEYKASGGQAVYDHLIENSTVDESGNIEYHEPDDEHELNHAIIGGPGDGVYLSVRRYGFSRSVLFYVEDGKVVDKLTAKGIYTLMMSLIILKIGLTSTNYPKKNNSLTLQMPLSRKD